MHSITFLQDLAIVMIVAGFVTILFNKFKQPVVLGYILAGVIIGPHTPPYNFISDKDTIQTLAELGVIFLMFSLGLEFNLKRLKSVGATAAVASLFEIVLMLWVGYELGVLFGWKTMDCLFLGAILSISSTTIIIKALSDLGKTNEKFAELIFGILIFEDILAIGLIALLSSIAMTGDLSFIEVGTTLSKLTLFLVVSLSIGLIVVPPLINYVADLKNDEMLLITVLGLCFGVCLLVAKMEYSIALGAFIIGAVIAESKAINKVEHLMKPLRDMFSAVFFVAIGLLIDPHILIEYSWPIFFITVAVVVGKVVTCSIGTFVTGHDLRTSLRVGMGLAQIGEFSFIIATLGLTLNATSHFLYPIAVTVSAITTLLTPYLIKSADNLAEAMNWKPFRGISSTLQVYTNLVGHWQEWKKDLTVSLIRRWLIQIAINIFIIVVIFFLTIYLIKRYSDNLALWMGDISQQKAFLWFAAVFFSLPFLIASFRKIQALGMLVSEISTNYNETTENIHTKRQIITLFITVIGTLGLVLIVLILSSTILPPTNTFLVLVGAIALIIAIFWVPFIKIYAKAQITLQEIFTQNHPPTFVPTETNLIQMSQQTNLLETITVEQDSPWIGKSIKEIDVRQQHHVSIVAIHRDDDDLINPNSTEIIRLNDQITLLGAEKDLEKFKKKL